MSDRKEVDDDDTLNLAGLADAVRQAETILAEHRARRDRRIVDAVNNHGFTMYAVAKITGLSQPMIKKIITEKQT
ncbi:hypothetical protein [Paeniglutamicibacter terrestris]|uniref:Uncharacterized protein n=1 Tax=Paeniglutamicibacter terrestris TaxID=2723403 RepID=A0ABX1G4F3_9MICC|nr:hypothetical protein [Paeniglutamicibacter terrestris]NKG21127.1 hypothetical protein [Paeniglutamicibacter terrestris]